MTNRASSYRQTIQPFVELKTTVSQIKAIILFGGKISLFANLRIRNTESYVFLAAKPTYVEWHVHICGVRHYCFLAFSKGITPRRNA
jgi:hypothetical protein